MATGNLILGTARKKLGDVVMYRRGGKQVSRIRVIPKNPQSEKQAVQRMCLAESAKLTSALKMLVNHSFEGIPVGEKSLQYFRRAAIATLRGAAIQYFGGSTRVAADFVLKGSPAVGTVNGLLISRGTIDAPATQGLTEGAMPIGTTVGNLPQSVSTQATYETFLKKAFNCEPGDQLTFLVYGRGTDVVASFPYGNNDIEKDFNDLYRYARITFVTSLPEGTTFQPSQMTTFPAAIIAESEGMLPPIAIPSDDDPYGINFASMLPEYYSAVAATVIRSKKNSDGTTSYSTAMLVCDPDELDYNDAYPTYLSFMKGAATVNIGDNLYLQNAELEPSSPNA